MGRKIGRTPALLDAVLGWAVLVLLVIAFATVASLRERARSTRAGSARPGELGAAVTQWGTALERFATARLDGSADLTLGFDPTTPASIALALRGHHQFSTDAGAVELRLAPLRFGKGPQLGDLFPVLGGLVRPTAGSLEAHGRIAWTRGGAPDGAIDVAFRELTVSTEAATIERLNGVVRLILPGPSGLPTSPPGQVLAMARVDLGLELRDGLVSFRLRPDGVIDLESASWHVAGGRVRTAGEIDLRTPERALSLQIEGISLAELLAIVKLEGLSGQGQIDGTLPITLRASGPEVRNGRIAARPGGWIRYTPAQGVAGLAEATPGFEVLLPALRNFHFEELSMELDGRLDADVQLGLHLEGANPDYLDGHPVRLNLNVEARLSDLLEAGEWIYEIPRRVQRRLEGFGEGLPPGE